MQHLVELFGWPLGIITQNHQENTVSSKDTDSDRNQETIWKWDRKKNRLPIQR